MRNKENAYRLFWLCGLFALVDVDSILRAVWSVPLVAQVGLGFALVLLIYLRGRIVASRYYKVSGLSPEELIASFGNSYHPHIAVTVDKIATATDIKLVKIVFFMRLVKSWVLFEQVLGRGNRVIGTTALQAVTSDVEVKGHFVIVDAVGVVEQPKIHTRSLEQKLSVSL